MKNLLRIFWVLLYLAEIISSQNITYKIVDKYSQDLSPYVIPLYIGDVPIIYPIEYLKTFADSDQDDLLNNYFLSINNFDPYSKVSDHYSKTIITQLYKEKGEWENSAKTEFYYYEDAPDWWRIESVVEYNWDSGAKEEWANKSKREYEYTDGWRMLTVTLSTFTDGEWKVQSETVYEYNENGTLGTVYVTNIFSDGSEETTIFEYQYDQQWRVVELIEYERDPYSNEYIQVSKTTYEYEGTSTEIKKVATWVEKGEWVYMARIDTWFDTVFPQNRLAQQFYYWGGEDWINAQYTAWEYDATGRNTSKLYQDWDETDWLNDKLYEYTYYGDTFNPLTENWSKWETMQWNQTDKKFWVYDPSSEFLIEHYGGSWFDGTYNDNWRHYYENNELGWMVLDTYEINYVKKDFIPYSKTSFTYYDLTDISDPNIGNSDYYDLAQNYPNPFNPSTTIKFDLPESGYTSLLIFNQIGEIVKELISTELKAGRYYYEFDATGLSSGIYYYRLSSGDYSKSKKMILLK